MKTVKLLFLMALVVFCASSAIAGTVTINGQSQISCGGTLVLNSMQVDNAGNVILGVTCSGGTCTPTSGSVSPLSIVRSITQGSTAYSQSVSVTDNCGTSLGYSAIVTSGSSFISVPSSGTGSMTVTFNTASLAAGSYTGTIQVTPSGYPAQNISVSITVSTTPPPPVGDSVDITTSGHQPSTVQAIVPRDSSNKYFFVTDKNYSVTRVTLEGMDGGATDSDLIISNVRQPQCSEIVKGSSSSGANDVWFNSSSLSNETLFIRTYQPAGTTVYATVCNWNSSLDSKVRISWTAY